MTSVENLPNYLLFGKWYRYSKEEELLYDEEGKKIARLIRPFQNNEMMFVYSRIEWITDENKTSNQVTPKLHHKIPDPDPDPETPVVSSKKIKTPKINFKK